MDNCEDCRALQAQLDSQRQIAGYDLWQANAKHNVFLREKLRPLITDAIDALEIETPLPDLAIRRLKAALQAMNASVESTQ